MTNSYIVHSGYVVSDSLSGLTRMLERDGFAVLGITSTPDHGEIRWKATCQDAHGNSMLINGRNPVMICVKRGIEVTHSHELTWLATALPEKPSKKRAAKDAEPEEREPRLTDLAFVWGACSASQRCVDAIEYLRGWGIITPDEQRLFAGRLVQLEKGGGE